MSELEFRDVPESDVDRALELWWLVFHDRPDEKEKRAYHRAMVLRCDRVGAYDGDALVGFLVAHRFTLSVPGGELPCPGLTFVSVAPTHRRRGVLSGMIAEVFRRCAEHGRPIAALWASEAAIYGRFGFGAGTYGTSVEINSTRPLALRIEPDRRPLRLIDPDDAPAELGPYYEATRTRRAGRIARDTGRWRGEWLPETDEDDDELGPPRIVGLGAAGEPLAGYALYRTRREDDPARPGTVQVAELEADTPAGEAALWNYLAGIDLTGTVRAWGLAPDDPLLLFATDRDQVRAVAEFPALWIRLVDVGAALTARSWAAEAFLVLEVRDDRVPANAGRFRLTASPRGCAYEPTEAAPDLTFDVRDLAACYLGGTEVRRLVRAGLVTEHTPDAAATLDAALRTGELPHTVDEF
ncbi:GNAT family N-acetyltransferase [Streptomyces sp. NPDC001691]|uniref:GNAT family N-acetyltransferase n=1 Tax=unclassified Streptomyces TaxID=2593676 RepID=UPI000DE800E1|nr:GNAT family N-acetyltransferase [Streptomyces sp. SDr-06]RCH64094.1 GNAT family N-acetyltransferase [Streptomyces sp. SDr-06]